MNYRQQNILVKLKKEIFKAHTYYKSSFIFKYGHERKYISFYQNEKLRKIPFISHFIFQEILNKDMIMYVFHTAIFSK